MAKKHVLNGVPAVPGLQATLVPEDSAGEEQLPYLLDCLLPRYKDGKCVRKAGSVSISLEGCYFMAKLVCPSEGRQCSVLSLSLVGLLERLNETAGEPKTPWFPTWERKKKDLRSAEQSL